MRANCKLFGKWLPVDRELVENIVDDEVRKEYFVKNTIIIIYTTMGEWWSRDDFVCCQLIEDRNVDVMKLLQLLEVLYGESDDGERNFHVHVRSFGACNVFVKKLFDVNNV